MTNRERERRGNRQGGERKGEGKEGQRVPKRRGQEEKSTEGSDTADAMIIDEAESPDVSNECKNTIGDNTNDASSSSTSQANLSGVSAGATTCAPESAGAGVLEQQQVYMQQFQQPSFSPPLPPASVCSSSAFPTHQPPFAPHLPHAADHMTSMSHAPHASQPVPHFHRPPCCWPAVHCQTHGCPVSNSPLSSPSLSLSQSSFPPAPYTQFSHTPFPMSSSPLGWPSGLSPSPSPCSCHCHASASALSHSFPSPPPPPPPFPLTPFPGAPLPDLSSLWLSALQAASDCHGCANTCASTCQAHDNYHVMP